MTVRDAGTELSSLVVTRMVRFSNNRGYVVTQHQEQAGAVTIMSSKVRVAAGGPDLQRALESFNRIWCFLGAR